MAKAPQNTGRILREKRNGIPKVLQKLKLASAVAAVGKGDGLSSPPRLRAGTNKPKRRDGLRLPFYADAVARAASAIAAPAAKQALPVHVASQALVYETPGPRLINKAAGLYCAGVGHQQWLRPGISLSAPAVLARAVAASATTEKKGSMPALSFQILGSPLPPLFPDVLLSLNLE